MKAFAYLSFAGNCQEALNYYSKLFDAEVINRQTYEGKKNDIPDNYRNKLQHAELKGKNIHIMAYDAAPDTPLNTGNQMHMCINACNKVEGKALFENLSKGGTIHHEYREREWGYFGRCTDKYGVNWMINCAE